MKSKLRIDSHTYQLIAIFIDILQQLMRMCVVLGPVGTVAMRYWHSVNWMGKSPTSLHSKVGEYNYGLTLLFHV
jgi:hypothetical protein